MLYSIMNEGDLSPAHSSLMQPQTLPASLHANAVFTTLLLLVGGSAPRTGAAKQQRAAYGCTHVGPSKVINEDVSA